MAGQLIGYLRVSSTDQNPERQVESIGPTDRNFTDYASGGSTERPELRELIGYARSGDRIRVASIDRLARSTHDLHELIHFFTGKGIGVEFVKEGLKFEPGTDASPMDQLMLAMLGAIAQFERALIRERQAEGIRAARKRGVYDRAPKLSSEQITEAQALIASGVPKTRVAERLGVSRSTLYQALKGTGRYSEVEVEHE